MHIRFACAVLSLAASVPVIADEAPPRVVEKPAALVADGIPYTSFAVDDVRPEFERLRARGVRFVQPPTDLGPVVTAVFDDTCGNLIQIASQPG